MEKGDKYFHEEKCKNCKKINKFWIPKGIEIKDFLKDKICFNCNCPLKR